MYIPTRRTFRAAAVVALTALGILVGVSQTDARSTLAKDAGPPVIVVIPDDFPTHLLPQTLQENLLGAVIRERGRRDVIVVNPGRATAGTLGAIVRRLATSRRSVASPARPMVGVVTSDQSTSVAEEEVSTSLEAVLSHLKASPRSQVGNMGQGRWGEYPASALGLGG